MADGEAGIGNNGNGPGKFSQLQASLAAAQNRERQAIVSMLDANRKNKLMLAQKTWETQVGSCTNNGQKAIFASFQSEWFSEYSEIGIADSYEEYLNKWGAKANRSLSAASITAITGQLSIGYGFNISLGYSLFGDDYGHSEDQVLSILDYIDKFLSTMSQSRGFSARSRAYKGTKFPRASVKGFGNALDASLGESLGGGRISLGGGESYYRGRFSGNSRMGYDREGRSRGRTAESSAERRGLTDAERSAGRRLAIREAEGAAARRAAVRYVVRYGRYFIL